MPWNALYVGWRREPGVVEYLAGAGASTYCPTTTELRRVRLRGGSCRVERAEVLSFPRYVFVKTARLFDVIAAAPLRVGRMIVLSMDGEPVSVRDSVLAALGAASRACRLREGADYRGAGALEGLVLRVASIERFDSRGEVSAWLDMFGSRRLTDVAADQIGEEVLA